jgi:hypothetical protein
MISFEYFPRYAVLASLALGIGSASIMAQTTGALYTTNYNNTGIGNCSQINGNIYADDMSVGLNGGPTKNDNLTDGFYYVQVTDPGGNALGISSTQTVTVSGNRFATCYQLWSLVNQVNDPYGSASITATTGFAQTSNPGGEYKVWISRDPFLLTGVSPTTNPDGWKTDNFKLNAYCPTQSCGTPPPNPVIYGFKCYDANLTGLCDGTTNTNPLINGWRILLDNAYADFTGPSNNNGTGTAGEYQFSVSPNSGPYTINETLPLGWVVTGCTDNSAVCSSNPGLSASIPSVGTTNVYGPNFANVCYGGNTNAVTLGFWSNQNGESILTGTKTGTTLNGTAVGALSNDSTTTLFQNSYWKGPGDTKYSDFRSWLLNATATNMSYMLSAQLATMELNVAFGKVSGSAYIYAPNVVAQDPSIPNKLGMFVSVNDLITASVQALDADKSAIAGDTNRALQQAFEAALDAANNNSNFVQSQANCSFSF